MPLKSWMSLGGGLLLSAILIWRLMWLSRDVMRKSTDCADGCCYNALKDQCEDPWCQCHQGGDPLMSEKIEPKTDPPTPIIPTPDPMPRQPIVPKPNGGKPSK